VGSRGPLVDMEGPIGTFTFPATIAQSRLLFVAGGTGIAPVRAMLDHALRVHPSSKISLLYSTREATSSRSSMNCVRTNTRVDWSCNRR
jgi:CDP-4-dehydro-6-deoxyglucose reductase/3-phenylpropionate/trans-cinnamate dioxygenase ferredoxin reductase subunit/phenol hydroxylase P5 protein